MTPEQIVREVLSYLGQQTYQGEPILHAIIACDFASQEHMVKALLKHLDKQGAL